MLVVCSRASLTTDSPSTRLVLPVGTVTVLLCTAHSLVVPLIPSIHSIYPSITSTYHGRYRIGTGGEKNLG